MADSKWIYSARAAVMTMLASFGGGFFSIVYTMIKNVGRVDILDVINSILCALVSITAGCFLYSAWDAIIIGIVGAMIVCFLGSIFDKIGGKLRYIFFLNQYF
jgi:Amt family ammonium transporter